MHGADEHSRAVLGLGTQRNIIHHHPTAGSTRCTERTSILVQCSDSENKVIFLYKLIFLLDIFEFIWSWHPPSHQRRTATSQLWYQSWNTKSCWTTSGQQSTPESIPKPKLTPSWYKLASTSAEFPVTTGLRWPCRSSKMTRVVGLKSLKKQRSNQQLRILIVF